MKVDFKLTSVVTDRGFDEKKPWLRWSPSRSLHRFVQRARKA
jgi:hypothetical protein